MSHDPQRHRLARRILIGIAVGLIACAVGALVLSPSLVDPGTTVSGDPRNRAHYVQSPDGTRIAVDVWLPAELSAEERIPTVIRFTRSWRSLRFNPRPPMFLRLLMALRLAPRLRDPNLAEAETFNHGGYALVVVDVRGTGASFGTRPFPWARKELLDYGHVVDWIVEQPWSNGRVGAYGTGYSGTAALLLAASRHPAVRAIAPRFPEFDPVFQLFRPGGLLNLRFVEAWSRATQGLDAGDFCAAFGLDDAACREARTLIEGVKAVDSDPQGVLLAEAVAGRGNADEANAIGAIEYRDQVGPTGAAPASISPYGVERPIEESAVPIHTWASWFDAATADAALNAYRTLGNPQVVTIGPWSHGGVQAVNPFQVMEATPAAMTATATSQYEEILRFFDHHLKDEAPAKREIRYYTLGEETWKTALQWPPSGSEPQRWFLAGSGGLSREAPDQDAAADSYPVDFTASTGDHGRWRVLANGGDIVFSDRRDADAKLLTYTTEPLSAAMELTGHPQATLELVSTETDGALLVYLEMIAPDSTVTLLTEGVLRLLHRRLSGDVPVYETHGPNRSFQRDQSRPVIPGEPFTVKLALLPLSVLVPPGYRLRIAVAGADESTFARCPAEGDPVLTVFRDRERVSYVDLPVVN
jgi:hypothetical protein